MSTIGNGTTGASGTGPASGYNLVISHLFIVFFLFLYRLSANTSNPYAAIMLLIFTHSMICFMTFGIKIWRKMPKTLTVPSTVANSNGKHIFQINGCMVIMRKLWEKLKHEPYIKNFSFKTKKIFSRTPFHLKIFPYWYFVGFDVTVHEEPWKCYE
jgi:hypothetical protein